MPKRSHARSFLGLTKREAVKLDDAKRIDRIQIEYGDPIMTKLMTKVFNDGYEKYQLEFFETLPKVNPKLYGLYLMAWHSSIWKIDQLFLPNFQIQIRSRNFHIYACPILPCIWIR